jgi:hypothetical protein
MAIEGGGGLAGCREAPPCRMPIGHATAISLARNGSAQVPQPMFGYRAGVDLAVTDGPLLVHHKGYCPITSLMLGKLINQTSDRWCDAG